MSALLRRVCFAITTLTCPVCHGYPWMTFVAILLLSCSIMRHSEATIWSALSGRQRCASSSAGLIEPWQRPQVSQDVPLVQPEMIEIDGDTRLIANIAIWIYLVMINYIILLDILDLSRKYDWEVFPGKRDVWEECFDKGVRTRVSHKSGKPECPKRVSSNNIVLQACQKSVLTWRTLYSWSLKSLVSELVGSAERIHPWQRVPYKECRSKIIFITL